MSYDMIRLYSGRKLVLEAILHEDWLFIYDNALYQKIIQLKKDVLL
jgi:hypothetical protein